MDQDADDPMFDVLLSEALGGAAPPDLSRQILAALSMDIEAAPSVDIEAELSGDIEAELSGDVKSEPLNSGPPPKHSDKFALHSLIAEASNVELSDSGRHLIVGPIGSDSVSPSQAGAQARSQTIPIVLDFGGRGRQIASGSRRSVLGDQAHDGRRRRVLSVVAAGVATVAVFLGILFGFPFAADAPVSVKSEVGLQDGQNVVGGDDSATRDGGSSTEEETPSAEATNSAGKPSQANPSASSKVARELQSPDFGSDALDPLLSDGTGFREARRGSDRESIALNPLSSGSASGFAVEYPPAGEALEDASIVAMIDQGLERYWRQQQVVATPEVSWDEFRGRISAWMGLDAQLEQENAVESIRASLGITEVKGKLARLLATRLLGPSGNSRLNAPQQSAFAKYLEPTIQGEKAFDETAVSLVTARGSIEPGSVQFEPAALWYGALAGPRGVPVVEQFGNSLLGVDLKCGRCHDHPLDARVWQEQYWQLTAVFETGVRWSAGLDGQLQVEGVNVEGVKAEGGVGQHSDEWPVIFFELPDGRQRAAMPKPPARWFGEITKETLASDQSVVSEPLAWVAAALDGSPQLARAAVNRAWEIVYGTPLVGSAADPSVAPESNELVELQDKIADQFRASDYNFGRLLSWIAAAKPMRLQAPAVFNWPAVESAGAEDLRLALRQSQVFAAYPKSVTKQPLNRMLVLAQVGIRGREPRAIDVSGEGTDALLGQFEEAKTTIPRAMRSGSQQPTNEQLLRAVLDAEVTGVAQSLPAAWLDRVWGNDPYLARVEHLYYLAGYGQPVSWQVDAARGLREALGDESAALRRLWWALSHAQE